MKRKIKLNNKSLLLFLAVALLSLGFLGDDKNGIRLPKPVYKETITQESGKQGDAYGMNINNIWLPLNRKGIIADVDIDPLGSTGQFAGFGFLFSSGFFLSGIQNGQLWANAVASASLVEDYIQGTVEDGRNDPRAVIYVINSQDEPFGPSWEDWRDAVDLGADWVDGDGDGIYNPVDLNGNGEYDKESFPGAGDGEDMPDLIGDETVWCVYHDGITAAQRRWNTVSAKGIEIRQTVFAFASAGAIGNIVFVRYRFKYVGLDPSDPDQMDEVYFGVWADPDVGDHTDDVVGVDVPRNAGYTYNNSTDAQYGDQVPCFMIDFFSGPVAYIPGETFIDINGNGVYDEGTDTPIDTATSVRGQLKGVVDFPGARNLPISSFVEYINGNPDLSDPNNKEEARNYMLGLDKEGVAPDPCTFPFGDVRGGIDCSTIDPRFWFSGDPVANIGWINNQNVDQRQMTNIGPFVLEKDVEKEIVVAYVVGRGTAPLDGITKAREIDDGAQNIFDLNFLAPSPPPAPRFSLSSGDDFIDITWDTPEQMTYANKTPTWDLLFEGYQVWAFKTNIAEDIVSGEPNSILLARYDKSNFISSIYKEDGETTGKELLYEVSLEENQLDSSLYANPETGRIRLRVFEDPFNPGTNVIKGQPYYFAVTSYALNYNALEGWPSERTAWADTGDYFLSSFAFAQEAENIRSIQTIVVGDDVYDPPLPVQSSNRISGTSTGNVGYDIVNKDETRVSQYEITFFKDSSSSLYSMYWKLMNTTTGTLLVDSSKSFTFGKTSVAEISTEGFIARVEDVTATIGAPEYVPASSVWYSPLNAADNTGVFYLGADLPQSAILPTFPGGACDQISGDQLRRVELRFGAPNSGKAYRYLNGYLGFFSITSYAYAPAITPDDTTGKSLYPIGNWDDVNDRPNGFVDVPFTAWLVDDRFPDEEKQLAVGFVERARTDSSGIFLNGTPDGVWDPTEDVLSSGEMIVIFNSEYDPNGNQIEYTGGDFSTPGGPVTVWADLLKASITAGEIPEDATGVTEEQRAIFNSSWFNAMYVIGLQRQDANSFYTEGDHLVVSLDDYPYTEEDIYQFALTGEALTEEEERDLWDRVNVYPNPLFGYNTLSSHVSNTPDEPFVTFTNLPEDVTVKIYALSGTLLRTLTTDDKSSPTSPFLSWNLQNESGLRVASGMYLAIVSNPKFGDKVLKFAIIMPQKQIQRF